MKKFISILSISLLIFANDVSGDEPTTIYSAAARPDGGENVFVVSQPDNFDNPLGNPIVGPEVPPKVYGALPQTSESEDESNNETMELSSQPQPVGTINNTPVQEGIALGKDFQNTLVEGNGRVYDIQSYPIQDIGVMSNPAEPQTIYSPNVNGP